MPDLVLMSANSNDKNATAGAECRWIPLIFSLRFIFRHFRLFLFSLLLVLGMGLLTWLGYRISVGLVTDLTLDFFQKAPEYSGVKGWLLEQGRYLLRILFLFLSRVIAFYLAFLGAYTLTSPGYAFLSAAAEKSYLGESFTDDPLTWAGMIRDLVEAAKIAVFGILISVVAMILNLIPGFGALLVSLLYVLYSTLMFVDYPASRRRLSLGWKVAWLRKNWLRSLRLGWLPALISMLPVVNVFVMALLFPLFTVHVTLNFICLEKSRSR